MAYMACCMYTAWYVGAAKRLLRGHPLGKPKDTENTQKTLNPNETQRHTGETRSVD